MRTIFVGLVITALIMGCRGNKSKGTTKASYDDIQPCIRLAGTMRGKTTPPEAHAIYSKLRPLLKKCCGNGVGAACMDLARFWSIGLGGKTDKTKAKALRRKARPLLRKACDKNQVKACDKLHMLLTFYSGSDEEEGENKAVVALKKKTSALMLKACGNGDWNGCFSVALNHRYRIKGKPDPKKAAEFMKKARVLEEKACAAGSGEACGSLIYMLRSGEGGKRDLSQAHKIRDKAVGIWQKSCAKALRTKIKISALPAVKPPRPSPRAPSFAPKKSPLEKVSETHTLCDAIRATRPYMTDESSKLSLGASYLAIWMATNKVTWAEMAMLSQTSYGMVQKDSVDERGKVLCGSGRIIQIKVDRTSFGKLHVGGMFFSGHKVVRFVAVGSSGSLVENSRGRYCGVVIGRYSYPNSGGGTTHAIQTVGMFKLNENTANPLCSSFCSRATKCSKSKRMTEKDCLKDCKKGMPKSWLACANRGAVLLWGRLDDVPRVIPVQPA